METIWRALGHDSILADINVMLANDTSTNILLEGTPGSGKSWLVKSIGALWEDNGGVTFPVLMARHVRVLPAFVSC